MKGGTPTSFTFDDETKRLLFLLASKARRTKTNFLEQLIREEAQRSGIAIREEVVDGQQ